MTSVSASRVTRSSRSLRLAVLVFAGVLAVAAALRAQESPPASAPPAAGGPAPAATTGPSRDPEPAPGDDAVAAAAAPTADPRAGPSPARFEPTEKVRADFDVSFPIDI